jgi:hypothetical protein
VLKAMIIALEKVSRPALARWDRSFASKARL